MGEVENNLAIQVDVLIIGPVVAWAAVRFNEGQGEGFPA